jgi:predicted RNase H-like HicB family nuclease
MNLRFSGVYRGEPEGGYSALCPELGVASQGETIEEAEASLREAVELYLESAKDIGTLDEILKEAGIDPSANKTRAISFVSSVEASIPA